MIEEKFGDLPFNGSLLRQLVVLKLWQVRDPFVPDQFLEKLHGGNFDWDGLRRLVRPAERLEPAEILSTVERRFALLRGLSDLEEQVVADAGSGRNTRLAGLLQKQIRECFAVHPGG